MLLVAEHLLCDWVDLQRMGGHATAGDPCVTVNHQNNALWEFPFPGLLIDTNMFDPPINLTAPRS